VTGRILACGGDGDFTDFLLGLSASDEPRVCFLPTACADEPARIVRFYERLRGVRCDVYHVAVFGTPEAAAERVSEADVVWVSGGNTANLLALWRIHGIDEALREVWSRGGVLGGSSAGANCWFEGCVTDSFGLQLGPLADGLALLAGSFCPHYDGEELRRPAYARLVDEGALAPGIACDDFAAVLYEGDELAEVVALRPDSRAYRVSLGSEEPLEARLLAPR
jgi:peptidase E